MHTKTQDHPVQHPLAVNVVWIGASVLGETAPEAAKLMELPCHYYWLLLGVFLGGISEFQAVF